MRVLSALCCFGISWFTLGTAAWGQVTVDDFAVNQTQNTAGTTQVAAAGAVGGFRDLRSTTTQTCEVAGTMFRGVIPSNFDACSVQYDGDDSAGTVSDFPSSGFTPVDFTQMGHDRLTLTGTVTSGGCSLAVRICDSTLLCQTAAAPLVSSTIDFLYSGFGSVDFTNVIGVSITLTGINNSDDDCSVGVPETTPVELLSYSIE